MGAYDESVKLIWSLTGSGLGTTIAANGNSGSYSATTQNARTAVDMRRVDDVWFTVYVGALVTTPSLKIGLAGYDDQGNLFGGPTASAALLGNTSGYTTAGAQAPLFGGRHGGGGSGSYFVLPEWGQIWWTISGGSMTGCEICFYGR